MVPLLAVMLPVGAAHLKTAPVTGKDSWVVVLVPAAVAVPIPSATMPMVLIPAAMTRILCGFMNRLLSQPTAAGRGAPTRPQAPTGACFHGVLRTPGSQEIERIHRERKGWGLEP